MKVPAATSVSMLVRDSDKDAYYIALLDKKGEPFAQFGWDAQGWLDFIHRIRMQLSLYNAGATLSDIEDNGK
jgi:hypothetical protein